MNIVGMGEKNVLNAYDITKSHLVLIITLEGDTIPILLLTDDQRRDHDLYWLLTRWLLLASHPDRPSEELWGLGCGSVILALSLGFPNSKTK